MFGYLCRSMKIAALMFVVSFAGSVSSLDAKPLELHDLAIAGDAVRTRLVFSLTEEAEPKFIILRSPYRLVIDLPEAKFRFSQRSLKARGLIAGVRYGPMGNGSSRIVITSKGPFKVSNFDLLLNEDRTGNRLAVDLEATSEKDFDVALAEQATATASTRVGSSSVVKTDAIAASRKRFTVVIDPGHGGIDGGANGVSGTVEKEVTLAFSRELQSQLAKVGNIDVFMTRDDDQFLRLDERVRFAREKDADLLISVHADTIRLKGIRGATVYTVSDRASDAESAALATRENLADELAGMKVEDEDHQIADILVDLIRRETHSFSMQFATTLVSELKQSITMINNPHRMAGFRVLKAPDVPSVLVELGYLSNEADEKHLLDDHWRSKAAKGIVDAVIQFAGPRIGHKE